MPDSGRWHGHVKVDILRTRNFVSDAARFITDRAKESISQRGQFRLGLCGGNTPRPVYTLLAGEHIPWDKTLVTFGDERCVGPNDNQSNFKMAQSTLLGPAGVPEQNVLRIRGELEAEAAALEYERQLAAHTASESRFVHDLLLLGLGDDGHTASLFPDTAALAETERNVVANFVPKFDTHRITFTYPLINAAREIVFLVDKPEKLPIVEEIARGGSFYPAAKVRPESGKLTWILGIA